jgi:hypothetical protein
MELSLIFFAAMGGLNGTFPIFFFVTKVDKEILAIARRPPCMRARPYVPDPVGDRAPR